MNLPSKMVVALARHSGPSHVLQIETVPRPDPGAGQVLVRVESASVNYADVKRRRGDAYPFPTTFPFVPGSEVVGEVVALGAGVPGPAPGSRVLALVGGDGQGGYAQFALAFAPQVMPLPDGLLPEQAIGLLVAGTTAMLLIRRVARLQAGESVLIPAAHGAVGGYAVQLARLAGASRIITLGSRLPPPLADHHVDSSQPGWADAVLAATEGRGVDVLLEASGGPQLAEGLRALAPFGRAVVYGAASGQDAALDAATVRRWLYAPAPNQAITAFNLGGWFMHRPDAAGQAVGEMIGLLASGQVTAPVVQHFPLAQAALAHHRLESRQTTGKLVLKPW